MKLTAADCVSVIRDGVMELLLKLVINADVIGRSEKSLYFEKPLVFSKHSTLQSPLSESVLYVLLLIMELSSGLFSEKENSGEQ